MTSRDREGAVLATLGATATVTGLIAILLAGSRGAWLGVLMGAAVLFALRPVPVRILAVSTLATATLFGIFYLSPAGDRLRARAFWISEDRTGGARLLLWQDSLHMAASRPVLGYGPDVFPAVFPQFQSRELARAYPDFAHESPHNVLLDLLTAEGLPGLILLLAMAGVGVAAGWKQRSDPMSGALLAGLVGCLVTQQFIVFVTPTALLFYTAIGLLTFDKPVPHPSSKTLRIGLMLAGVPMAAVFLWAAHGVGSGDRALFWARTAFEAAKTGESAEAWQAVQSHRSTGVSADIELSRSAMAATARAGPFPEKMVFAQLAAEAAQAATLSPEFRVNAWYNLAVFQATSNSAAAVEASLRAAITTAPRWFKPHWMLARVLAAANRRAEARQEAEVALDLDNKKHTEVTETLETIFRSPGSIK